MTGEVLFTQERHLGLITLNRPSALNALTLPMIMAMQKQLELWKADPSIHAVVVQAAGDNAFCAGGDVRWLYQTGKARDPEQMQFFWHEYRLNHFIHEFGKPYIALMNGMTMGGGVGISLHGSHPIASERFVFAMPETGIGFFPDIGASHLLNKCPGYLGIYLGLTGSRLGADDALKARLVKGVMPADKMPLFVMALAQADLSKDAAVQVNICLQSYLNTQPMDDSTQIKPLIDECFSAPSVELIRESLDKTEGAWALGVGNSLDNKSPLSLKVTLAQLQKNKTASLARCLRMDYDLVGHFMRDQDFYEGVRALLVDKDKNPKWNPATLDLVTDDMVVNYFEALGTGLDLG